MAKCRKAIKEKYKLGIITLREREVLYLIASECTSKEIAKQLYICPETVNTYRYNLKEKLRTKNTAGIVRKGFELGFLNTDLKRALE